jgi:membrane peptidoglycan carboxypeptidase
MTQGYAAFANGGELVPAKLYTQIINKSGQEVETNIGERKRVWSEYVAFIISSILSDSKARAELFGSALTISRPAAVKTGTTDNYKDAWTIGYTPDLIVGVWVGNNYNEPMSRIAGSLGAAPVWRELMERFHQGLAVKNFDPPDGIVKIAACIGGTDESSGSAKIEYFVPGTQPSKTCFRIPRTFAASESGSFEPGIGGAPPTDTPQDRGRSSEGFNLEINSIEIKVNDGGANNGNKNKDKSED